MSVGANSPHYFMCHLCAHAVEIPAGHRDVIECDRCGHCNHRLKPKSPALSMAFALTALVFYVPAMVFPFMSIELYGNRNTSTIWEGIVSLVEAGSWPIALIVFLASIFIPLLKLLALFYLSAAARNRWNPKLNTQIYRVVEAIGRWSMLDIFLLAVLVAILKLGPWTSVEPQIGALMFALVVIFTMFASSNFDPQLFWKENNDEPTH